MFLLQRWKLISKGYTEGGKQPIPSIWLGGPKTWNVYLVEKLDNQLYSEKSWWQSTLRWKLENCKIPDRKGFNAPEKNSLQHNIFRKEESGREHMSTSKTEWKLCKLSKKCFKNLCLVPWKPLRRQKLATGKTSSASKSNHHWGEGGVQVPWVNFLSLLKIFYLT